MDLLIGLDVGTSAIKGLLVSASGVIVAQAWRGTHARHPRPGRCEWNPETHYRDLCAVLASCARQAPRGARIRGMAMASASGNALLLDRHNRPLTPIICWMDARAAGQREKTLPGFDYEGVREVCGWPWSDGFPLAVFAWFRKYHPRRYSAARRFCTNIDYLLFRLTGRWGLDLSTATPYCLADQRRGDWHRPHLEALDIPSSGLPRLMPSGALLGPLSRRAALDTGLPGNVHIVLGAFDHPCAARGAGILAPGEMLLSCGTSWVGFHPITDREQGLRARMLIDPFLAPAGPWAGMTSLPYVGRTVDWAASLDGRRTRTGDEERWVRFNRRAALAEAGAGGFFVRPFFDRKIRRPVDHERLSSMPSPFRARAVMEGLAYEMRRHIERAESSGMAVTRMAMVGGPTRSPTWPQIVCDVTGRPVFLTAHGQHAGALGAALLAGIGCGLFRDAHAGGRALRGRRRLLQPDPSGKARYEELYRDYLRYAADTD